MAPCVLPRLPQVFSPANASRINPRARTPDPGRCRRLQHTHTHTHIGSSETAGLRRWTLHGGKGSLVRQAQASASTFINFNFNLLRSCQALTHSHPRSSCGLLPTAPTRHVTLSNLRHLYSFTTSQTSSFPLRRFKTPTDHVLREPASHPIRHSLRRFTPVLHFRIASLRLGLSVA